MPPNGDISGQKAKKTLGYTRRAAGGRATLAKQFSTTKVCVFQIVSLEVNGMLVGKSFWSVSVGLML